MNLADKVSTTIHTLLYILEGLGGKGDFHKIFKILYFAEREHLVRYGSLITEDSFVAMNNGPVPSLAYDIFKSLRGEGIIEKDRFTRYFDLKGKYIVVRNMKADLDELSESAISCLDRSIEQHKDMNFHELTELSHDYAWEAAFRDCEMSIYDVAKAGGATPDILKYIHEALEIQNANLS